MKPILAAFAGDLHVGSDTGVCLPGFPIGSKQKRPYQASANQEWLFDKWQTFVKDVKKAAKGKLLLVCLGGDLVDGVMHHESSQTWGVASDQRNMAIELLMPLVGAADWCYGVTGTAAHVGDVGDDDAAVYEALRVDYRERWRLNVGARHLWWAHHGLPVGTMTHTLEAGAVSRLRSIEIDCAISGRRKPDAIVAHDRHRVFTPFTMRGISVGVCPCWQAATYYGGRWPFSDVTIGGMLWDVESNMMRLLSYDGNDETHTITSAAH